MMFKSYDIAGIIRDVPCGGCILHPLCVYLKMIKYFIEIHILLKMYFNKILNNF